MGRTSIPCSKETRKRLKDEKQADETWDDLLERLADGVPAPENNNGDVIEGVEEVLDQVETATQQFETLVEEFDDIEASAADGETNTDPDLNMNELREIVRMEVRNEMQDVLSDLTR